jgi:hypothetical protein
MTTVRPIGSRLPDRDATVTTNFAVDVLALESHPSALPRTREKS